MEPTTNQRRALERIRRLWFIYVHNNSAGGKEYRLPTGRRVGDRFVTTAIDNGWLVPRDRGLFPGFPQTYEVAE